MEPEPWDQAFPGELIAVYDGRPGSEFLYRPGEVLVDVADAGRENVREVLGPEAEPGHRLAESIGVVWFTGVTDPLDAVAKLERLDPPARAEVNHVYLAGAVVFYGGAPNYPGGAYTGAPNYPGGGANSARPAAAPPSRRPLPRAPRPVVAVLDTGLPLPADLPATLRRVVNYDLPDPAGGDPGDIDEPDAVPPYHYLDRMAGHGLFIAGIIHGIAPAARIEVDRVLDYYGSTDDAAVAAALDDLQARLGGGVPDVVNLSFAGYDRDDNPSFCLARKVRQLVDAGTVVVAAAGNNASCRITWPAGLPGVIGVAALSCRGPAPFTNFGPWVRASAPGEDVLSLFFKRFNGSRPPGPDAIDPDDFHGWARNSGTSFAAPRVAAAIAARMRASRLTAGQAAYDLIDAPGLVHLPDLGTVVNVVA